MKQVMISKGAAIVDDVPVPSIGTGEVLVRTQASCLSTGTEVAGLMSSGVPLWRRALRQPEHVVKTAKMAMDKGVRSTIRAVEQKRDEARPSGYSAAGVVVEVGADVRDIVVGDRVACAGGGYAVHAEYIRVPRNLCVVIPGELTWDAASTVTLGAIALQGIRRAKPTLGETFLVIGLGILGQLTAQLLRANGCRAIGTDPDRERVALAEGLGLDMGLRADADTEDVYRMTNGVGADGVIITASTSSDEVVSQAFKACRRKGRVVLVGDVGLDLNRADFYAKEIDFLVSTSYGPGRYDQRYEEEGLDYPVAYVRWTENRNMQEYLRLVADRSVDVEALIDGRYEIDDAGTAYAALLRGNPKPLMTVLSYSANGAAPQRTLRIRAAATPKRGRIRVAVAGAGSFATSSHLPNIGSLPDRYSLETVMSRSSHTAAAVARRFGAANASTDYAEVLSDPGIDAVLIVTRHNLHASMALDALRAGKHVLVEKPLVLNRDELRQIDELVSRSQDGGRVLMTGYNRRFSPCAARLRAILRESGGPFVINYRMNAGYVPRDHWVHGPEGGGRNLGEACHIYDLFTYLADAGVSSVKAISVSPTSDYYGRNDNFIASLGFDDGSLASLSYTAMGNAKYPKEMADIYSDGTTAVLNDYVGLDVYGRGEALKNTSQDKGFKHELIAFADGVNSGQWPIPWWQQKQVASVALDIEDQLTT